MRSFDFWFDQVNLFRLNQLGIRHRKQYVGLDKKKIRFKCLQPEFYFVFLDYFDVLISKIKFKKYIILIYFQEQNFLKSNFYHCFKQLFSPHLFLLFKSTFKKINIFYFFICFKLIFFWYFHIILMRWY